MQKLKLYKLLSAGIYRGDKLMQHSTVKTLLKNKTKHKF